MSIVGDPSHIAGCLALLLDAAGGAPLRAEQARRRAAGEVHQLGIGSSTDFPMNRPHLHLAVVEVDTETGEITLLRVITSDDAGQVLEAREGGSMATTAAVQHAVVDAISHLGVHHVEMPATPYRVLRAIQQAATKGEQLGPEPGEVDTRPRWFDTGTGW